MIRNVSTVSEYLAALTPEERADISKVRRVVRDNLPPGFKETVQWGMICYAVPLSRFSATYNGQALCYAALAAQKNHHSLYLMNIYGTPAEKEFRKRYAATGRRLDMGKSCVRFKSADELPLDLIGDVIAATSVDEFIAQYQRARANTAAGRKEAASAARRKIAKKAGKKRGVKKR